MSDIFREVDEALRRERFMRVWRSYALFAIVLVVLTAIGAGGYGWWQGQVQARQEAASLALDGALEKGAPEARLRALEPIYAQGDIYGIFAGFHRAAALAEMEEWREAGDAYKDLAQARRVPQPLRDLARLKGGIVLADHADFAEVQALLTPATDSGGYFRASAREALALVAFRAGEIEMARDNLQQIINDTLSPETARQRARLLLEARFGDGGRASDAEEVSGEEGSQ